MTPRRARPLAAAAICAMLALAACGSDDGDGGGDGAGESEDAPMEFALQDDATLLYRNYYDRDRAIRQVKQLGVGRIKANVDWARAAGDSARRRRAPDDPQYDFSAHDSLIDAAGAAGIEVQLALTGPAPAWASGAGEVGPEQPDPEQFGRFAADAARHFRGRVDRYSIWNEPNYVSWLSPQEEAPQIYRRLYEAGHGAIKEADADAEVLIAETAPYEQPERTIAPLEFVRGLACVDEAYKPAGDCEKLEADGFAHHPYDFANPPDRPYPGEDNVTIGSLDRLTKALDRLAAADALTDEDGDALDLYLTEFGYFASGALAPPERRRARWLVQAFETASRNPRVHEMLQYLLVQPPKGSPGGRFDPSLVTLEGEESGSYHALRRWASGARRQGEIDGPEADALNLPSPGG